MPSIHRDDSPNTVEVLVPGSTMLMGEHAVLRGHSALVCAVGRFIRVQGTLTTKQRLYVRSSLGDYDESLDSLVDSSDFRFVLAVVKRWFSDSGCGLELVIDADFSHQVGFGSSAAVTVAVELACRVLLGRSTDIAYVLPAAVSVVRSVQGCGSGADVAASLYGGVIAYDADSMRVAQVTTQLPISLWYSGYKTPTPDVIRYVAEQEHRYPTIYPQLFQAMGSVTYSASEALSAGDWKTVGQLMNIYQGLMDSIGVTDLVLGSMLLSLRKSSDIHGVKISGSGLGDCVVALHRSSTICPLASGIDPDIVERYIEAPVSSVGASFNGCYTIVS